MLEALDQRDGDYRLAYSSESYVGLSSAVRAGLAVTAMSRAAIPDDFRILGPRDGFPDLPAISLGVASREAGESRAIDSFIDHLRDYFARGAPEG